MKDAPSPPRATLPSLPFGVYVHVPYCRRRCPYCDFYFEVRKADRSFAEALHVELCARSNDRPGEVPRTLYFGGGTPTALPDDALAAAVTAVADVVGLAPDAEVTVEANPEDLGPGRCRALAALGVNRLSLGVQSFEDDVLRYLGRAHKGAEAEDTVKRALDEGIARVSVDLIAGVPGERPGRLEREVERLVRLGVGHVSAYLLTVEAGTPLEGLIQLGRRGPLVDDLQADAYEALQELLPAAGFRQYEVSSFSRPGEESRHNRLYWAKGTWLGLGPGAHSMRLVDDGRVERRHTTARLEAWLDDPAGAAHEREVLSPGEAFHEAVAFGLRDLVAGVRLEDLAARHGVEVPAALRGVLAAAAERRLVACSDGAICLTALGARFADAVARDVLTASG